MVLLSNVQRQWDLKEMQGYDVNDYHLHQNDYSFDALQTHCFGINIKL